MDKPEPRKGARRMAEIPPAVLRDLNSGKAETITLVEWLAIDNEKLVKSVAGETGLGFALDDLVHHARRLRPLGILQRTEGMAAAVHQAIEGRRDRAKILKTLSGHASDVVRNWAAYVAVLFPELPLEKRLEAVRPFAADRHMGVRELAWMALRPHLAQELDEAIGLLAQWTGDPDENVRRFASEATRPRGVWCAHIEALKDDPSPGLKILAPLNSDSSLYVRRSVANWLNDASKTRPGWVKKVVAEWMKKSKSKETAWIANHATRTIRKKGLK